jgi:hypothetical protein
MENDINQGLSGTHQNQASFMLVGGWKSSSCSPLPVEGEIFSLTFPFIDQAFAQACAISSPTLAKSRSVDWTGVPYVAYWLLAIVLARGFDYGLHEPARVGKNAKLFLMWRSSFACHKDLGARATKKLCSAQFVEQVAVSLTLYMNARANFFSYVAAIIVSLSPIAAGANRPGWTESQIPKRPPMAQIGC